MEIVDKIDENEETDEEAEFWVNMAKQQLGEDVQKKPDPSKNVMDMFFGQQSKKVPKEEVLDEKQTFLITGISGFVGSHLASMLKGHGFNVVGILRDVVPSDYLYNALSGCTIVQGDIRDQNLIRRIVEHYKVDNIYHIAAHASVKEAINIPRITFETNVMGTLNILESIRDSPKFNIHENGTGTIVILNTDKVYGEKEEAVETDCYQSSEIYATSKACQGLVANTYRDTYDLNIKMAHSCNIFGLDMFNDRLIPNTIKACIRGKSPVIYTNDESIREYVYVDDAINALYSLLSDSYQPGSYNIGTGWVYNQRDIVKKIVEYYNDVNFEEIKPIEREGKIPQQIQRQSLKSVKWNWKPKWTLEEAIAETVDNFMIFRGDWE